MVPWNEIIRRIVPDYNSQINARNDLKRQYQRAITNLENGDSFSFPESPSHSEKLGDKVYQHHLQTQQVIKKSGYNSGGEWHITDEEAVKTSLNETIRSIKLVNLWQKSIQLIWMVAILVGVLLSLYVGIFGFRSLVSNVQNVVGNNSTQPATYILMWNSF
ncbi:hypothetical protein ACOJIV_02750 [Haloarcula sp. AONF1]